LTPPAKLALEELGYSRIGSPYFWTWNPREDLSQDARLLLDKCKALKYLRQPETVNKNVIALVEEVLAHWSYDTVLKLALTTWHFDHCHFEKPPASASDNLISFLSRPNKAVIEILQDRYRSMMGRGAALNDSFDFLLVLD
jgi:hypothetical protein